jgi:hypothetical protein
LRTESSLACGRGGRGRNDHATILSFESKEEALAFVHLLAILGVVDLAAVFDRL